MGIEEIKLLGGGGHAGDSRMDSFLNEIKNRTDNNELLYSSRYQLVSDDPKNPMTGDATAQDVAGNISKLQVRHSFAAELLERFPNGVIDLKEEFNLLVADHIESLLKSDLFAERYEKIGVEKLTETIMAVKDSYLKHLSLESTNIMLTAETLAPTNAIKDLVFSSPLSSLAEAESAYFDFLEKTPSVYKYYKNESECIKAFIVAREAANNSLGTPETEESKAFLHELLTPGFNN
jgi:hypothetical protein